MPNYGDFNYCITCDPAGFAGGEANDWVMLYLRNGTNKNMKVDGSSTPVSFSYKPPEGRVFLLHFCNFELIATAAANVKTKFGTGTALANGIRFRVNGNFPAVEPIKTNLEIQSMMMTLWAENEVPPPTKLAGNFSVGMMTGGRSLSIFPGTDGFEMIVNDNIAGITGISSITMMVKGVLVPIQA